MKQDSSIFFLFLKWIKYRRARTWISKCFYIFLSTIIRNNRQQKYNFIVIDLVPTTVHPRNLHESWKSCRDNCAFVVSTLSQNVTTKTHWARQLTKSMILVAPTILIPRNGQKNGLIPNRWYRCYDIIPSYTKTQTDVHNPLFYFPYRNYVKDFRGYL